jgi:hypothetical protein
MTSHLFWDQLVDFVLLFCLASSRHSPLSIKTHDLQYLITCSFYDTCRATSQPPKLTPPYLIKTTRTVQYPPSSLLVSSVLRASYRIVPRHTVPHNLTLQTRLILYTSIPPRHPPIPYRKQSPKLFISVHISLAPLLVIFTISWTASVMMRPPFFGDTSRLLDWYPVLYYTSLHLLHQDSSAYYCILFFPEHGCTMKWTLRCCFFYSDFDDITFAFGLSNLVSTSHLLTLPRHRHHSLHVFGIHLAVVILPPSSLLFPLFLPTVTKKPTRQQMRHSASHSHTLVHP